MPDLGVLKADLRKAIEGSNPDGTYTDDAYDRVKKAIDALLPHSPIARPLDDEAAVAAPWRTLFAQFGPKHTAGKAIEHDNMFNYLSFNVLPKLPVRNLDLIQEIEHETKAYNNLNLLCPIGGGPKAWMTIRGRYEIEAENPQRYGVEFYELEMWGAEGQSADELRSLFGFDLDQPLKAPIKSPTVHSDVVYCDDEIRINFGSLGGVYVLERIADPWRSLALSPDQHSQPSSV